MKTTSIYEKLTAYSALSAAFLFTQEDAHSQVVFTDADPDFIYTEETSTPPDFGYLFIDYDGDSENEAVIGFGNLIFTGSCYTAGYMSFYLINYTYQASVAVTSTTGGVFVPKKFNEGDTIDADENWNNDIFQRFIRSDYSNNTCDADVEYAILNGNWNEVNGKYLGLRFPEGSGYVYGWVRMNVNLVPDSGDAELQIIQVYGYAVEQTDTFIVAGDGFMNIPDVIINQNSNVQIFPNPVQNTLCIHLENYLQDAMYFTIHDVHGQMLMQGKLQETYNELTITNLNSGLYILSIQNTHTQTFATQKFIKQ